MTAKKRIAKWDNVRLLLIFGVVLGHLIGYVNPDGDSMDKVYLFLYAFHMPAFVFLSGLFAKRAIQGRRVDKAFSFLQLYFVIKFSMFFAKRAVGFESRFELLSTLEIDWYALAMFLFYLAMMFLQRYDKRYVIPAVLLFGCMACYDPTLDGWLVLSRAAVFFPFFVLGYYIPPDTLAALSRRVWCRLAAAGVLAAAGWTAANRYDELKWTIPLLKGYAYGVLIEDDLFYWGGLYRLAMYAAALLMTLAVCVLMPSIQGFWTGMGSRTMSVYALHFCAIFLVLTNTPLRETLDAMPEVQASWCIAALAAALVVVLSIMPLDWLIGKLTAPPSAVRNRMTRRVTPMEENK